MSNKTMIHVKSRKSQPMHLYKKVLNFNFIVRKHEVIRVA